MNTTDKTTSHVGVSWACRFLALTGDVTGDRLRLVAGELVSRGLMPRWANMTCSCGAAPDPAEQAWSGCFVEGDSIKYLCGSCWLLACAEADAEASPATHTPAVGVIDSRVLDEIRHLVRDRVTLAQSKAGFSALESLLADRDYWRNRCAVSEEDVAAALVSWGHIYRWCFDNGVRAPVRSGDVAAAIESIASQKDMTGRALLDAIALVTP